VYCFWTGSNEITPNRKRSLEQFKSVCEANVILVTKDNLKDYLRTEAPLHPAYEFLSDTQKSDYLRCYFMHFIGGGYSDIKETTGSWKKSFDDMETSGKWACGYKDTRDGVAHEPDDEAFKDKWDLLIGCGAYIFKPKTALTQEWFDGITDLLNKKLPELQKNPAKNPQDSQETGSGYPIEWNKFNRVFHKLIYKYHDKVLQTLPICIFTNYRGGSPNAGIFDKVFYINLDHREDRKEQIENELKKMGIDNFERFPAVKHDYPPAGCNLSHLNVLKIAKEKNYRSIIILEDDFEFLVSKEEFWKHMDLIKNMDYDIIMLSYNLMNQEDFNDDLFKVIEAQTTSGYLINNTFYDALIQNLEEATPKLIETHDHGTYLIDQSWKRLQPQSKWYAFKTRIGKQRKSHSDLGGQVVNYMVGGLRKKKKRTKKTKRKKRV